MHFVMSTSYLWRMEWQSTPVFLPGEFHGQRSLAGYSPQDRKKSDVTEQLAQKKKTSYLGSRDSFCRIHKMLLEENKSYLKTCNLIVIIII